MVYKHLQDDIYYNDLYDRITVDQCRRIESRHKTEENAPQHKALKNMVNELFMHFITGDRFKNKSLTIQAWKTEDKRKDDLLNSSEPIANIHCLQCNGLMECIDKELVDHRKKESVLFMYECTKCNNRRAFYDDRREYRSEKKRCEKCQSLDVVETVKKKPTLTIITTCKSCGHIEKMVFDSHEQKIDPHYIEDRNRFCLTDEEGQKYLQELSNHEAMVRLMEEVDERDKAREEKLKEHPEGFHLFDGEGYTCPICRCSMTGTETWFDKYGQKCMKCKKNIDDGVIPPELCVFENKDMWMSNWQLKDETGLTTGSIKKCIRSGELKARSLTDNNGYVYCQVFLTEENKDFLASYLKKKSE